MASRSSTSRTVRACHGAKGSDGAATDLANPEYLAWVDDASLRAVIEQGEKGSLMPAFALKHGGTLTESQIDVLVQGMRAEWSKPDVFGGAIAALRIILRTGGTPSRGRSRLQQRLRSLPRSGCGEARAGGIHPRCFFLDAHQRSDAANHNRRGTAGHRSAGLAQ